MEKYKLDYEQSLYFLSLSNETRETRVTEDPAVALVSRISRPHRLTLARACTALTKSEENDRLFPF